MGPNLYRYTKGSVSPIDLMQDAKWNLCPMEVDDLIGPKKIFHGGALQVGIKLTHNPNL
jgi:hypothetical protein